MFQNDGNDDDKKTEELKPDEGGPEAGDYTPDPNMPIPGETEGIENSQLG
jgi:hypothetical protein